MFGWHDKGKDIDWQMFLDWDLAVIEKCDAVYRIKGNSKGADIECRFAKRRGIPVFYSKKSLYDYGREHAIHYRRAEDKKA